MQIPNPHPIISPEYFSITPQLLNNNLKALYVSYLKETSPQVLTDTFENILQIVFPNKYIPIYFDPYVIMYIDPYIQFSLTEDNFVATTYYRNYFATKVGTYPMDTIKGNALFFGSFNLFTQKQDDNIYSVPYSLVEEILNIYETQT